MHFASMSLGILDFLIEWLTTFLIWLIGWVFDLIFLLFADLLFSVGTCLLEIVDMIQLIFKKLSGLDTYWIVQGSKSTKYTGVDPLMSLMTNDDVVQVLITLTLVSVVMVIVAAIIKIIQSEFSSEGAKNSKGAIFGQALKSLMLFLLVPVCCIGGVGISNALLKAINNATNLSTGAATLGSSIFVSAATNCNRIRSGGNWDKDSSYLKAIGYTGEVNDTNREEIADLVDMHFKDNTLDGATLFWAVTNGFITGVGESALNVLNGAAKAQGSIVMPGQYYYQSNGIVDMYYNIKEMNFITYIGAALLAAMTMLNVSFGMIMRLFKGLVLYMISPPMIALMPLDGGSAFKSWRKSFIGQVLAAYGTIVALNLLFIILPVVDNLKLFMPLGGVSGSFDAGYDFNGINSFVSILVTLTGLFMIKDITKMISDMIGADDASAAGAGMAQKVGSTVGKIGAIGVGAVGGVAMKGLSMAKTAGAKSLAERAAKESDPTKKAALLAKSQKLTKNAAAWGNTGNKLFQGAKGTLGSAINKGIGSITGGAVKGHFSEETDFAKAQEEKKKRDERLENGEATLGDWMAHGVSVAGREATKFNGRLAGAVIGARDEKGKWVKGGAGWTAGGKVAETMITGDGGQSERQEMMGRPAGNNAVNEVAGSIASTNQKAGDLLTSSAITKLVDALGDHKNEEASAQISAILAALDAIANKTEEQKDLIQKLTNAQSQLDNGRDSTKVLAALGGSGGGDGSLDALLAKVGTQTSNVASVASTFSATVNVSAENNAAELATKIAEQLAATKGISTAKDSDGNYNKDMQKLLAQVKRDIITAQKAELEKMKEEK